MSSGNILLNGTGKRWGNHILSYDKPKILVKQKFYQKPTPNIKNMKETRPCSTPTEQALLIRKKSRTAYFIFQDEKRVEMKAQFDGQPVGKIAQAIGKLWAKLTESEKRNYQRKAAMEKKQISQKKENLPLAIEQNNSSLLTIPVGRVRKICRLDPDVRGISKESVHVITKAAEEFVIKIGKETSALAKIQNRRTVVPDDVMEVCSLKEYFLFLREDVRDLIKEQRHNAETKNKESLSHEVKSLSINQSKKITSYFKAALST